MKLAACVILYHPDESVIGNIGSYIDYVDKLLLIDNSGERSVVIQPILDHPRVEYINLGYNSGIAFALNRACEIAMQDGYNWILTMDQDSSIDSAKFFPLLDSDKSVAAMYCASFAGTKNRWIKPFNATFNEIHFTITSGCVMSLEAWKSVGGFDNGLFIDEVDHDMCMKIRNKNLKILTTKISCLKHKIGIPMKSIIGDLNFSTTGQTSNVRFRPQPFRTYYHFRNSLSMVKRYSSSQPQFAMNRIVNLLKTCFRIIIYFPDKKNYFQYARKGVMDFIKKRQGEFRLRGI